MSCPATAQLRACPRNIQPQALPTPSNPFIPPLDSKMIFEDRDEKMTAISFSDTEGSPFLHIWEECFEDLYIAPVTGNDIKMGLSVSKGEGTEKEEENQSWEVLAEPFWVSRKTGVEVYTRPTGDNCKVVPESGAWEEGRDFCDRPFWLNLCTFRETRVRPHEKYATISLPKDLKRLTARATAEMEDRFRGRQKRGPGRSKTMTYNDGYGNKEIKTSAL